jgi:hypothetical protein
MTILVTLTLAGADTGPFDIYSDVDAYTTPLATDVSKEDLEAGYTLLGVPDDATILRTTSTGTCTNSIDMLISGGTTTTTTTTSTTTTTTTIAPEYDLYLADEFSCDFPGCTLQNTNVVVSLPSGTTPQYGKFYPPQALDGFSYLLQSTTSTGPGKILLTLNYTNCSLACSV